IRLANSSRSRDSKDRRPGTEPLEWIGGVLVLNLGCQAMIKRSFALVVFRHVFPRYNGYIHHAPTTGSSQVRGLLGPMPDSSIMHSEITRVDVETHFSGIGVVIDEILFPE